MRHFPLHLLAAVALKAAGVGFLQQGLLRWRKDPWNAALAAWLMYQILTAASLLGLSAAHAMTSAGLWASTAVLTAGTAGFALRTRRRFPMDSGANAAPAGSWPEAPAAWSIGLGLTIAIGVMLAVHSLYFYDLTDDALNFGLTRISYWYQNHSLFVQAPPRLFESFAWEWNADLNALFYFLATGRDRACAFGNVELWGACVAAAVLVLRGFRAPAAAAWAAALFLATMPAVLSLGMTIKGDLACLAGTLMGLWWTWRSLRETDSTGDSLLAIIAFSYAAGSKVSGLPLAGLMIGLNLALIAPRLRRDCRLALLAGIAAAIGCSRHLVNLVHYGKIVASVSNQPRGLSLSHLAANAHGILSALFARGLEFTQYYALFGGAGLVGIVAFTLALVQAHRLRVCVHPGEWSVRPGLAAAAIGIFAGSMTFMMASLPWFLWSFRYYLPWLAPLLLAPFVAWFSQRGRERIPLRLGPACLGITALSALQFYSIYRPSEVTPGRSLGEAYRRAAASSGLERKLSNWPEFAALYRQQLPPPSRLHPHPTVLVLCGSFSKLYPLLGDDASNRIEFADTDGDMERLAALRRYDLVVITEPGLASPRSRDRLAELGYVATSSLGMTFAKPGPRGEPL